MIEHSKIPPSSAHIWGAPNGCTGWPKMAALYPETGRNPAAELGTAAHELAAAILRHEMTGAPLPHGSHDGEMYEYVKVYTDDVLETANVARANGGVYGVEQRLQIPQIHPESFGTVDAFAYDPVSRMLSIWDLKYGYGIVDANENWQATNYAAGVLPQCGPIDTVYICIIQPRAFHRDGPIRRWRTTPAELAPRFEVLRQNAAIALSPEATTRSGPHCRYCQARHACPAALAGGVSLYEATAEPLPENVTPAQMTDRYFFVKRAREQLEYLETGYEAEILARLNRGERVPGVSIEQDLGREMWTRPAAEVETLGALFGVEITQKGLLTPLQARKALHPDKRGLYDSIAGAYCGRNPGKQKIVKNDLTKIEDIFK